MVHGPSDLLGWTALAATRKVHSPSDLLGWTALAVIRWLCLELRLKLQSGAPLSYLEGQIPFESFVHKHSLDVTQVAGEISNVGAGFDGSSAVTPLPTRATIEWRGVVTYVVSLPLRTSLAGQC